MNFSLYDSQEIEPSLVSYEIIFEALVWAIQNRISCAEFENPGTQPI